MIDVNAVIAKIMPDVNASNVHDLLALTVAINDVISQRAYEIMIEVTPDHTEFDVAVQINKDTLNVSEDSSRLAYAVEQGWV